MPINPEALALAAKINKELKADVLTVASEMKIARRFRSGSVSLDVALGGGWPGNQWLEILGPESHGKTVLVLKTIAANQQADPSFTTLWIAAEHYDKAWASSLGVDNDRVIVVTTQQMELAYTTMLQYAESRTVDCVVLDSYPALIADEEAEKDMDEAVMAIGARLTGKFFRKAGLATSRSLDGTERPMLGFIINQWRDAIGQWSPRGTPKTSPGGKAKNYAFYVRCEVARAEWKDEKRPAPHGTVRVGQTIKVTTIKNKSAAPQQVAAVDFYFRDAPYLGFKTGEYDTVKELRTLGLLFGVIQRQGVFYEYSGNRWKGKEAMIVGISESPDLQDSLYTDILAAADKADVSSITEDDIEAAESSGTTEVARR